MKYVRGYLVAVIFAAFTGALNLLGERLSQLLDMFYPFLTRSIMSFLAQWSAGVDFLLWQMLAIALIVVALATVVLMVILRWNPIQWLGWALAAVSVVFFLHTGIYGLNNYAGPLAEDIRLNMTEYSLSELEDATEYYRDQANTLSVKMDRDGNGDLNYPTFEELALQAADGFDALTYERSYSVFAGETLPVKELGWADMYTSMGITGFTFPLTGEAAVNPQIPVVSLPFTMCHEMAHRRSIAPERDANFTGFLAASHNESIEFQYSAYFMAYKYCYNALAKVGGSQASAAAARIRGGETEQLRHDLTAYDQFFAEKKDAKATKVATTVNNSYIQASGDDQGVMSYGQVCDYLVSWHYQEVIAPTLVEEEQKFDPYDEPQVDLSGLPYSPSPTEETTEEDEGE